MPLLETTISSGKECRHCGGLRDTRALLILPTSSVVTRSEPGNSSWNIALVHEGGKPCLRHIGVTDSCTGCNQLELHRDNIIPSLIATPWCVVRLRMGKTPPIYIVPENILNNSRGHPADTDPPALGLGVGLTTPHGKKKNSLLRNTAHGLGLGRILCNDLSERKWT
jgi:hypothetical protein